MLESHHELTVIRSKWCTQSLGLLRFGHGMTAHSIGFNPLVNLTDVTVRRLVKIGSSRDTTVCGSVKELSEYANSDSRTLLANPLVYRQVIVQRMMNVRSLMPLTLLSRNVYVDLCISKHSFWQRSTIHNMTCVVNTTS